MALLSDGMVPVATLGVCALVPDVSRPSVCAETVGVLRRSSRVIAYPAFLCLRCFG